MKKILYSVLTFYISLLTFSAFCQPTQEWVRLYPDTSTNFDANATLAIDDSSNTYVTGHNYNNTGNSFCTIKYSPSGFLRWSANYYSNNTGGRSGAAIAIDKFSNVYVTGSSFEYGHFFDYCTIKYNLDGIQQWIRFYDDNVHGDDESQKIAVDNAGNIYVSGYTQLFGGGYQYTTIKYSSDGNMIWIHAYPMIGTIVYMNGLCIDDNCNVYIAGDYGDESITVKYDSSGNQLWAQVYSGINAGTGANYLSLDNFQNVYITGHSRKLNSTSSDYFTIKYSSSGLQQWVSRYSADTSIYCTNRANSLAIDNRGNVYVSGYSSLNSSSHMKPTTLKYSNSGMLVWAVIDSIGLTNQSTFMAIDKNNNIYFAGSAQKNPPFYDYLVIKYDTSGIKKWADYNLSGQYPTSIRVDSNFNIYLSGSSSNSPKVCTIKYSQTPIGIVTNNNIVPKSFKLEQNYPNPFNPTTKIKFDIPSVTKDIQKNFIQIIIYDILGKEIQKLTNTAVNPGSYEIEWNASNYPSGIYFYKLITEGYIETRKMILIK